MWDSKLILIFSSMCSHRGHWIVIQRTRFPGLAGCTSRRPVFQPSAVVSWEPDRRFWIPPRNSGGAGCTPPFPSTQYVIMFPFPWKLFLTIQFHSSHLFYQFHSSQYYHKQLDERLCMHGYCTHVNRSWCASCWPRATFQLHDSTSMAQPKSVL